jgi:bifunctional DNA-binding transcriptional regulator/antitoxin component of YhaV-PrlF toxin-antitoxin module
MTASFLAKLSANDELQIAIPDAVRKELGLEGVKEVAIMKDGNTLRLIPLTMTIDEVRSSIPAAPGVSIDLDEEIEEAIAIAIREKYG